MIRGGLALLSACLAIGALRVTVPAAATLHDQPAAASAGGRPNLLFIVTDDQAHWSLGSYGNADARTPHLDRLAREGVRFSRVFTPSPVG